jgi:URI fold toxin 2
MEFHGNSTKSKRANHLYVIIDKVDGFAFKFGISAGRIGKDGLSRRVRAQITFINLVVGWDRFFGEILVKNIVGRIEAEKMEDELIENFSLEHGKYPRGNAKK